MSVSSPYPIYSLRETDLLAPEEMGSKRKGWVQVENDSERWLFKYARMSNEQITGEHWAEKVVAELAEVLRIPHARVELATLDGAQGCLSRRFPELAQPGAELIHGNELLGWTVSGYDQTKAFKQHDHTLAHIMTAIERVIPDRPQQEAIFQQLAGYIILDALILNTDRHHENWGLIRRTTSKGQVTHNLAPSFDHASSLGRNEPLDKLKNWLQEPWRSSWYAERAEGAIYLHPGDKRGTNPLLLPEEFRRRAPSYFQVWSELWKNVKLTPLLEVIDKIPVAFMAEEQRGFTKALLQFTFSRLSEILR